MSQIYDVLCLSHLRWDFVYQRPQHLLSRTARHRRVFYLEEPVFGSGAPRLQLTLGDDGVTVVVPHLPEGTTAEDAETTQRLLVDQLIAGERIHQMVLWYYTPMPLAFTHHLDALAVVYDCMDELSAFKGASPTLRSREEVLLRHADLVFTGGHSLYEHKRDLHHNIHPFPSSVDLAHFARARAIHLDPPDQAEIAHPRIGWFGVIDERFDLELMRDVATARPDLQFVMIGPVVKIDPASLPRRPNLHWLGARSYAELPHYIAGWDVAIMPFARNDSTRFISPTKTPEYLAAGKPVVATSIRDVVRPYGERALCRIADTAPDFIAAIDAALAEDGPARIARADGFLAQTSWDRTWAAMWAMVEAQVRSHAPRAATGAGAGAGAVVSMAPARQAKR